jgi:tetratricopeptide (TPR) repeat protein
MSDNDPPYFQAAYYYFSNNKDLRKAQEWAKKATEENPDGYYIFYLLAEIQAKNGEKEAAITSANKSIELSKQNKRDDYVDLNNKLLKILK